MSGFTRYRSASGSAFHPGQVPQPSGTADVAATIYHRLGIGPRAVVTDQQGRPFLVSEGRPIRALLG